MGERKNADEFETLQAERVLSERHPVYDVCAHGATGDGTTDDTDAIQTALDAADEDGGGVVYLPRGEYYTTYTLLYGSNLVIYGPAATIRFEPSDENATALVSASFDGTVETSRVTIQGLTVESVDPEKGNGIGMAKAEDMAIKACQTHGLNWHLVDIAGAKDVLVSDCYAANLDTAAFQADNLTSEGGLVVEHADGTTEGAVVDGTNNENVDIEGNVAENCGRGVHLHRDGGHDLTIRANRIRECSDTGILGDASMHWHDVIVTDNIVEGDGTSNGIHLKGEYSNLSVQNNTVRDHDGWGIAVHPNEDADSVPEGVTIKNNTVERVAGTAIALNGAAGDIADNYVYDVGESEESNDSDEPSESEESTPDTEHVGVSVHSCNGVTVAGNVIRDIRGTGVVCRHGSTDVVVSDNNLNGFEWALALHPEGDPLGGVDIENNKLVGSPSSRGGVWAETGRRYRINDNVMTDVAVGFTITDATDLRLTGNDAIATDGAVGYGIRNCADVVARGNDATGFDEPTVITEGTVEARAECPHEVRVDADCEGVLAHFEARDPPESGAFAVGSRIRNTTPSAGEHLGWVCVTAGSTGVWKPYGYIEP